MADSRHGGKQARAAHGDSYRIEIHVAGPGERVGGPGIFRTSGMGLRGSVANWITINATRWTACET